MSVCAKVDVEELLCQQRNNLKIQSAWSKETPEPRLTASCVLCYILSIIPPSRRDRADAGRRLVVARTDQDAAASRNAGVALDAPI